MKKNNIWKRLAAFAVALALMVACVPVSAYAVANTPADMYIRVADAETRKLIKNIDVTYGFKTVKVSTYEWTEVTINTGSSAGIDEDGYYNFIPYVYSDVTVTFAGNDAYPAQTITVTRTKDDWDEQRSTAYLNPYKSLSVTLKNSDGDPVTNASVRFGSSSLSHQGSGVYSGKFARGTSGTLSVSAAGYSSVSETVTLNGNISKNYTLDCPTLTLDLDTSASGMGYVLNMATGQSYTITPSVTLPADAVLGVAGSDDKLTVTANGTSGWTVTPKATGSFDLRLSYSHNGDTHSSLLISGEITRGSVSHPAAPTVGSGDTDKTQETFRLPSDLKMAKSLTVKAEGAVQKSQTYTNLSAGQTVTMNLSSSVVRGEVKYTFTYASDEITYSGTAPTQTKKYYKSLSNVSVVGPTTLYYNGQSQQPAVTADGAYVVQTGMRWESGSGSLVDNYREPGASTGNVLPNGTQTSYFEYEGNRYQFEIEVPVYLLKVKGDESAFYKGEKEFTYTIEKRPLTVKAKDQTLAYGDAVATGADALTVSGGSLVSGHTMTADVTPSTTEITTNGTVTVSNVKVMNGTTDVTDCYNITVSNAQANLTIRRLKESDLTVEIPASVVYAGGEITPAVVKRNGKVLTEGTDYTASYENNINVGEAKVTLTSAKWEAPIVRTFAICKAPLTVTAKNKEIAYGDAVPDFEAKYSGFAGSESAAALSGTLTFDCDYRQFSDKGEYAITLGGLTSGNYDITFVPGTLKVGAKKITVTIADKSSVYGAKIAELTAEDHGGIVNNDKDVYALTTAATSASDAGTYAITGTTLDANYDIKFVGGTYTVTKAKAVFTAPPPIMP